ncbi:hypothetical protein SAMN06265360_110175 [Haloechinothrix alba]|uniref:Acyl-CoA dehydrogenase n=1 Tax=Haloechinothrix alba TaxID=664784 RepID=A0A238XFQ7_9PSEU|nr:acyl-CoA dehydrogenase family protein [Haloechinothrix alba]SNR57550.1 hypothetical protein SAMN06265360_110175 [Haloechinothrix alba]
MPGTTDEQEELARTIRSVLEREPSPDRPTPQADPSRGYDAKLWSVLCEQVGVAALAVPERFDGVGAGVRELQVAAEELGKDLIPSPLLGSAALAARALLESGDEQACERLLPRLATGEALATLAWAGADGRWDPDEPACTARPDGEHHTLDGTAHYVLDGDLADILVVAAAHAGSVALFEVNPDQDAVTREHTPAMDQERRLATVSLHGARGIRLSGADGATALRRARDTACAVLAAEQAGAAARALETTVEYTKNRVQFGRPIGSFQALKHRMADMHVLVETARSASYAAGEAFDAGSADAEEAVLAATVHCSDALSTVASEMIQLHGGIAITWEHDAHRYFKRAHSSAQLFGQPHEHLERLLRV